jgi:hypothetical protein
VKTEDLLRYQAMYAAMGRALGTPWLVLEVAARRGRSRAKAGEQPQAWDSSQARIGPKK